MFPCLSICLRAPERSRAGQWSWAVIAWRIVLLAVASWTVSLWLCSTQRLIKQSAQVAMHWWGPHLNIAVLAAADGLQSLWVVHAATSTFSPVGSLSLNSLRMRAYFWHWHCMEWTEMWICQRSAYFKFILSTHTGMHTRTHTQVHTCVRAHTQTHACPHTRVHTPTHAHTHARTCTHTHTHTHTHILIPFEDRKPDRAKSGHCHAFRWAFRLYSIPLFPCP